MRELTVSLELLKVVPAELLGYLESLAAKQPDAAEQTFRLEPDSLGGRALQRIEHFAGEKFLGIHQVFGFDPMQGKLRLCFLSGECQIVLEPLFQAAG